MKKFTQILLLLFIQLLAKGQVITQDIQQLKALKKPQKLLKGKGIKLTGLVSANNVYYQNCTSLDNRLNPFTMVYTGNLTLDVLGKVKMPINFTYSNQQTQAFNYAYSPTIDRSYQNFMPINRLTLKPTYKGFSMQIGTCAMTFSPYTLAGHRYQGVGLQYKSSKTPYYFGLMWGNLQSSIDTTKASTNNLPVSYRRTGVGVQVGYKKKQDKIELIFFTAADKLNSLPYTLNYGQSNTVFSLKADKVLVKNLLWQSEVALSGMTEDVRAIEGTYSKNTFNTFLGTLNVNSTTNYRKAIKTGLIYQGKTFLTGIEYSRIDPQYKTLGAYYFNNDLETLAGKLATKLLQGKLTLNGNIGLQRNLGTENTLKTNNRLVGALSINALPTENINLMLNYSTFSTYSNLRPVYDYLKQITPYSILDTTNYHQVNQNIMVGVQVKIPTESKDISKNLNFNMTSQFGEDQQGSTKTSNNLMNYTLDYTISHNAKKLSISPAFYYSNSNLANQPSTQWGPSIGLMKGFGQIWKTTAQLTFTKGNTAGVAETMGNIRVGAIGKIAKEIQVNFSANYINRQATSSDRFIPPVNDLTLTLGLMYNFTLFNWAFK